MICFKCGEQNPYGSKVCSGCNARIINVPPAGSTGNIDIKEIGATGDPFGTKSKKFNFKFPYMAGNFLRLMKTVEGILAGDVSQDKLQEILDEIEEGASNYLYKSLPAIEKKIEAPGVANYRELLTRSAALTRMGFKRFLEAVDELEKVLEDGQNYHLERGLSICYKASNLVSLGCVLADRFSKKKSVEKIEAEIAEYLKAENITLDI